MSEAAAVIVPTMAIEMVFLLVDEVLAVGDEAFTRKCLDKISEFHRRGKTIVFVTHTLGLVAKMCDDVLWLRHGRIADRGDPQRVVDALVQAGTITKALIDPWID